MFHEYRRQGKEGSKQRAINFDWDVVDTVFPSFRDGDRIAIRCRRIETKDTVKEVDSWLKRQHKNWRFEGDCPTTTYYKYVTPGVLFAMVVNAGVTPAKASWVVLPVGHPAREAILNHGESARLGKAAMIALHGDQGTRSQSILAAHFPDLFEKVEPVPGHPKASISNEAAPDPLGLFNILARAGHSLPSAVADLVDNSLSHKASRIDILFPKPNNGGRWLCIRDNGEGMTPEGLRDAMKIGHQRDYDEADLGKFGYGLKGAAWSQADRLTVVSKVSGKVQTLLTWDKDHLAKTRRWELLTNPVAPEHESAVELGESGTAVLLTQMRPTLEPVKGKGIEPYALELAGIKDHLELVFHRYLEGKVPGRSKVVIQLEGESLRPNNPMEHPLAKVYNEQRIELPGQGINKKAIIAVRPFVLPNDAEFESYIQTLKPEEKRSERLRHTLNGRANDAQGFYFYRLHRLIKWGGWDDIFAKDEHTKLLRVAVDFDRLADEQLQVDISKQLIRLPFMVAEHLKSILKAPRAEARSRYDTKVRLPSSPLSPKGGGKSAANSPTPPAPSGSASSPARHVSSSAGGAPLSTPKSDRPTLRIVSTGSAPWERKTGFSGEHVEVTPRLPELVALVTAIDGDAAAKAALSEFLRVLEKSGALKLLSSGS